jgi:hypothetical protein
LSPLPTCHRVPYITSNNNPENRIQLTATFHVLPNRDPDAALVLIGPAVLVVAPPTSVCVGFKVAVVRIDLLVGASGVCVELELAGFCVEPELVALAVGTGVSVDVDSAFAEVEPELVTVGVGSGEVTHSESVLKGTIG